MKSWKNIKVYEGLYRVSSDGEILSLSRIVSNNNGFRKTPERLLKQSTHSNGYLVVTLCKENVKKKKRVHRLVALAFKKNPKNLKEVNHIDGDKKNNYYNNLEWCTRSENVKHCYKIGLR